MLQHVIRAPALINLEKKSQPDAEEKAFRLALIAAKGCNEPLPVLLGKRIIGWVKGENFPDPTVYYARIPKMWFGFATYDALINAMTSGSKFTIQFSKTPSTGPVATNWYDDWAVAGLPVAGAFNNTALTAVVPTDATAGALYHGGNVSTATKHLISTMYCISASTPVIVLYDRLVAYDQCTTAVSATKYNMTNTATMSRYIDAGTGGASGGKMICTSGTIITSANTTSISGLTYTDDAGNVDQAMPTSPTVYIIQGAAIPTATLGARIQAPSLTAAGTTVWSWCLPMVAGDKGARLIKDYTITWSTAQGMASTFALVRPLAVLPVGAAATAALVDMVMQVSNLERIVDGAALGFMHLNPAGTTGGSFYGSIDVAWA